MSHRLPEQQDKPGTYMEEWLLEWLIENRLDPGEPERETSRIWGEILHWFFKLADGFSTGLANPLGCGEVDLFLAHLVESYDDKILLVVECEATNIEAQKQAWEDGQSQLERHLKAHGGTHQKFGAVAMGRAVRFYELIDGQLAPLLHDATEYDIGRQCQDVISRLRYVQESRNQ
ncbi:hypothetical protein B0I35DRAFT_443696 [Stachybotrys elegans]|uniref:Uncharacterized protein n=1 Tax=Stachybotrys elegans TaxID=80388 RepID=A0A8K0SGX7_9HYPO|nr:hypothetical protein B0I35DRAFT_443696 [Stachybotrys elegans]